MLPPCLPLKHRPLTLPRQRPLRYPPAPRAVEEAQAGVLSGFFANFSGSGSSPSSPVIYPFITESVGEFIESVAGSPVRLSYHPYTALRCEESPALLEGGTFSRRTKSFLSETSYEYRDKFVVSRWLSREELKFPSGNLLDASYEIEQRLPKAFMGFVLGIHYRLIYIDTCPRLPIPDDDQIPFYRPAHHSQHKYRE